MDVKCAPHVVDLSHHNGPVDFSRLKAAGVVGVIAKATEGTDFVDSKFTDYHKRATAAGLLFLSYHFLNASDLRQQIRHYVTVTQGIPGRVLDFEHNKAEITEAHAEDAWRFLRDKQRSNPATYGSDLVTQALQRPDCVFKQGGLWIARYNPHPPILPHGIPWDLWQYSQHGVVDGAQSDIDLSVFRSGSADDCAQWLKRQQVGALEPGGER